MKREYNTEIFDSVVNWINQYFAQRAWTPNKQFLAEHIIDFCHINTVEDVIASEGAGTMIKAVEAFEEEMLRLQKEVEKQDYSIE